MTCSWIQTQALAAFICLPWTGPHDWGGEGESKVSWNIAGILVWFQLLNVIVRLNVTTSFFLQRPNLKTVSLSHFLVFLTILFYLHPKFKAGGSSVFSFEPLNHGVQYLCYDAMVHWGAPFLVQFHVMLLHGKLMILVIPWPWCCGSQASQCCSSWLTDFDSRRGALPLPFFDTPFKWCERYLCMIWCWSDPSFWWILGSWTIML